MKTITTREQLDDLPDGAVILSHTYPLEHPDQWAFQKIEGVWHRGCRCSFTDPDYFLPATLIHPLAFDEDDMERAMEATFEAIKLAPSRSREAVARAVLGAVGSVEA